MKNFQFYGPSFMNPPTPAPEVARDESVADAPMFLINTLRKTAEALDARFLESELGIDTNDFYLYVGWNQREGVVTVNNFGVKEDDDRRKGLGSKILSTFLSKLAITISREMEVRLWSRHESIGFYLKEGFSIPWQNLVNMEDLYYARKAQAFGPNAAWASYQKGIQAKFPDDRDLVLEDLLPLYLESPIYDANEDYPQLFSLWIADTLGQVANNMHIVVQALVPLRLV